MPSIRVVALLLVPTTLLVLAAAVSLAGRGNAATAQAPPVNTAVPTISGEPVAGEFLHASTGTWTGAEPRTYTYQWQRCNAAGANCADAAGSTSPQYTVPTLDIGLTLRVVVTATNADGSKAAASAPSDVIQEPQLNATGCPPVQEAGPLRLDEIRPPARLEIDRQTVSPSVITRATQRITLRFHVIACDARTVVGALVYATPTPFEQFQPVERATDVHGWATLSMRRLRFFPVSGRQQQLTVFVRARNPREELLGGISTRRLVAFRVRLGS
jgi:hypothetical protein